MVQLPKRENTTNAAVNSPMYPQQLRPYLGMSELGHSCTRYLWYSFRWCFAEEISSRINRLFKRGDREEPAIIAELVKVGVKCYDFQEEVIAVHGHVRGHNDGKALGIIEAPKTEHLLEFKTMADKYFKQLKKEGVKAGFPKYFAQMQMYMKHLELTRAYFVSINKNNDDWYDERIYFDQGIADTLENRAEGIVLSEVPPKKEFKPTWFECKWCNAKDICHGGEKVEVNCRTCQGCDLLPDGKWECSSHEIELTTSQQRIACERYTLIEGL